MSDMLPQIDEIQSNVREIKATWGNTVTMLDNIKTSLKADRQKAIDEAYERGLNDAWDAARKINMEAYDGGFSVSDLEKIFAINSNCAIMRTFTAKEAIAKIKAYEAEKDEIRVGDEVRRISDGMKYVVVDPKNEFGRVCGFSMNGIWYGECPNALRKTGRHFDIESILKGMQS